MQPLPRKVRRFVERQAQWFVSALHAAKEEERPYLALTLDEFPEGDMALLYACLWLAYSERVAVLFEAPPE